LALIAVVQRLRKAQAAADREVGGVRRCCVAPQSRQAPASVPPWAAFPEVSRVLVERLLSQLVERMVRSTARCAPNGGAGGERDDAVAVGAGRGQGPAPAP
jgi:hypothetical protein